MIVILRAILSTETQSASVGHEGLVVSEFSLFCAFGIARARVTHEIGRGMALRALREFQTFAAVLIFSNSRCSSRKAALACVHEVAPHIPLL